MAPRSPHPGGSTPAVSLAPRPHVFVVRGIRHRPSRPPWVLVSLSVHVALLFALGFVRVFQAVAWEPPSLGPAPIRRIRLRAPEGPKIDADARAGPGTKEPGASWQLVDPWPDATPAEHAESADALDLASVQGEDVWLSGPRGAALGFGSRTPGVGIAPDAIGVGEGPRRARPGAGAGQGGGVRRGDDRGGKLELALRGGGSDATEQAVAAGLRWLARHQAEDGSWGRELGERCGQQPACHTLEGTRDSNAVGLTSLALLSFLDAGYGPGSVERSRDAVTGKVFAPGETIRRALRWLLEAQAPDGSFGGSGLAIYDDALGTFALADALGRTDSVTLRGPVERGVAHLLDLRNRGAGWRYGYRDGETDTSATAWCVLALRSAQEAGVAVPDEAYEGARRFVVGATARDGVVGYLAAGDPDHDSFQVVPAGLPRLGNTPAGLLVRMIAEGPLHDSPSARGENVILANLPRWDVRSGARPNFFFWYYGSLELFHAHGPSGEPWRRWNAALVPVLLGHQRGQAHGCRAGSWDPGEDWWAALEGGRVLATALDTLTLEVYYRHRPLADGQ